MVKLQNVGLEEIQFVPVWPPFRDEEEDHSLKTTVLVSGRRTDADPPGTPTLAAQTGPLKCKCNHHACQVQRWATAWGTPRRAHSLVGGR